LVSSSRGCFLPHVFALDQEVASFPLGETTRDLFFFNTFFLRATFLFFPWGRFFSFFRPRLLWLKKILSPPFSFLEAFFRMVFPFPLSVPTFFPLLGRLNLLLPPARPRKHSPMISFSSGWAHFLAGVYLLPPLFFFVERRYALPFPLSRTSFECLGFLSRN